MPQPFWDNADGRQTDKKNRLQNAIPFVTLPLLKVLVYRHDWKCKTDNNRKTVGKRNVQAPVVWRILPFEKQTNVSLKLSHTTLPDNSKRSTADDKLNPFASVCKLFFLIWRIRSMSGKVRWSPFHLAERFEHVHDVKRTPPLDKSHNQTQPPDTGT